MSTSHTVSDIAEKLGLKVVSGKEGVNNLITGAYVSDLLSDVMGNISEGQIWITLQTHKNIMAISSLKDVAAVILVKGLQPSDECEEQSNKESIPILSTELETFEIAGKLYDILMK
jgi:predicted transcriptional regulator